MEEQEHIVHKERVTTSHGNHCLRRAYQLRESPEPSIVRLAINHSTLKLVVAVKVVVAAEVGAAAGRAARLLVNLGDDGGANVLHLLHLLVEVLLLGVLVVVEPLVGLLERLLDRHLSSSPILSATPF